MLKVVKVSHQLTFPLVRHMPHSNSFSLSSLLHQNSFFALLSFPLSLFLNRQHHLIPTVLIFSLTKSLSLSLRRNQILTKVPASVVGKQIRLFSIMGNFNGLMVCLISLLYSLNWLLEAEICGFVLAIWKIEDIMVNWMSINVF